ncbi:MAG TPA: radical SAM protein [Myxococcota bacterium]|nr:radical SAM protein [Myxococcota bacterium]HRY94072.1 radical SAM protein [Myxococcota bacterium]
MKTPRMLIVVPPLALDRDFVDSPAFLAWPAYLAAAVVRQAGLEVEVLDGLAAPGADLRAAAGGLEGDALWVGQPAAGFLERLEATSADAAVLVGSPFLIQRLARPWLRAMLERLGPGRIGRRVLADLYTGGMHYLDYDGPGLLAGLTGLDLILRFEGERLLRGLAEEVRAGAPAQGGVRSEREAFPLDDLPAPAWELLPLEAYFDFLQRVLTSRVRAPSMQPRPARTLPLQTSRGCPYGCCFCTRNPGLPAPRRQVRPVPWPRVDAWLQDWRRGLELERVVVLDEIANLEPARFTSLLGAAERLGLRLEFPNGLRADLLSEDQLRRLRRLTDRIKVSLESASPRVQQEVLGKRLDPGQTVRVAASCHDLGLALQVHALIGLPGETRTEVMQTLALLAELRDAQAVEPLVQFPVPLPGSELAARLDPAAVPLAEALPYASFQQAAWPLPGAPEAAFLEQARAEFTRRLEPGPGKLIVNLTYLCNNRCVFCAVGDRPRRHAAREEVEAALRSQREAGTDLLDLDGGEPSLHPDLVPLVELARGLGYRTITLITNARRLSYPAFARRLVQAGVGQFLVSVHGPDAAVHEALTCAPGSFEQTRRGLRAALEAAGDAGRIAVNTTVVAGNLARLGDMGAWLAAEGVTRWNLQLLTPFGRAHAGLLPAQDGLQRALEGLLAAPPAGLRLQVINCPPCRLPGREGATRVDFGKRDRAMLFVGGAPTNLRAYLAERRRRIQGCASCAFSLSCGGDWDFERGPAGEGAG